MAQGNFFGSFGKLFGFKFSEPQHTDHLPSPVTPNTNDGSVLLGAVGSLGYTPSPQPQTSLNEQQLITRYREMALNALVDWGIDEIVNEAIVQDETNPDGVQLDLSNCTKFEDSAKQAIINEFKIILQLLNWTNEASEIFRSWYTDGRLYYQKLVPEGKEKEGIQELRYIDPRQIRKYIEVVERVDALTQIRYKQIVDEYYIYAQLGIDFSSSSVITAGTGPIINGTKLTKDSIAFVHSGRFDPTSSVILSYLHKAIRPLTQLNSMENSTIIYKIGRATERRVWKIPTGSIHEKDVAAYLQRVVAQYRSRMSYDATTGDINDERKAWSIIDDIFIPVPSTGESVQVENLQGGAGFEDTNVMDYYHAQLLKALNVPNSRTKQDATVIFGNTGAIAQDERKFTKFISHLRRQFSGLFNDLLSTQLRLKGIVQSQRELDYLLRNLSYQWSDDTYHSESAESSLWSQRISLANEVQPFIGKYFSNKWVNKNVLKFTEEEQLQMQEEIKEEIAQGLIIPPGMEGEDEEGFPPYATASGIVKAAGVETSKDFQKWIESPEGRNSKVPTRPDQTYRDDGWTTWNDFLGTDADDE